MNLTVLLVFVFAALTIFALVKVVAPFLEDRDEQLRFEVLDEELREIEELVARKSVILQSLRDIEFDHETGKLSEEDYERLKTKHERRAVQVMAKLDELRGDVEWDDAIDSALEERLRERAETVSTEQTETPASQKEEAAVQCPECDKMLEPEARFCSRCGHQLADDSSDDETDGGNAIDEQTIDEASGDSETTESIDADLDGEAGDDEVSETAGEPDDRSVNDLRSEATG